MEKRFPYVKFVAVHMDKKPLKLVLRFIEKLSDAPEIVVVANRKVKDVFKINGVPYTVVADGKNRVKLVLTGYTSGNMKKLENVLRDLN